MCPCTPYNFPMYGWYDGCGTLTPTATDTAPTEPISLREAKAFLRVDFDSDDLLIAGFITAARSQAEVAQRRVLVSKQFDLHYDYWPAYRIALLTPTVSVDLVQYTDNTNAETALVSGTGYVADLTKQPAIVTPPWGVAWPAFNAQPSSSILIRFTAGYAVSDPFWTNGIGSNLKVGMLLLISHWYTNRLPAGQNSSEYPYGVSYLLGTGSLRRPG